jgi:hypothetical protein
MLLLPCGQWIDLFRGLNFLDAQQLLAGKRSNWAFEASSFVEILCNPCRGGTSLVDASGNSQVRGGLVFALGVWVGGEQPLVPPPERPMAARPVLQGLKLHEPSQEVKEIHENTCSYVDPY